MSELTLDIKNGEFILICGESGSGKTTLLKNMKEKLGMKAGYVSQNVRECIVTDKVWHELAFGLESLGCPQEQIRRRVAEMTSFFGISELFRKKTSELSGGEAQLVLLASVMSTVPDILLLDEPTSQLDPVSAEKLLAILEKIHNELGTTVIIAEHRFSGLLGQCTRMVLLENMEIIKDGSVESVCRELFEKKHTFYSSLPVYVRAYYELGADREGFALPKSVNEGRSVACAFPEEYEAWVSEEYRKGRGRKKGEKTLGISKLSFSYDGKNKVLDRLDLDFYSGSLTAVLGANGSGKTTLLSIIAGMEKGYTGSLSVKKGQRILLLCQNPRLMFMKESIREELLSFNKNSENPLTKEGLEKICRECKIEHILDRHPYDVSGGEIQRAALAKLLVGRPDIILLDEPTKGMEGSFKSELAEILDGLCEKGLTVVMASHDLEFAAKYADDCVLLFDGRVASSENSDDFFDGNSFYTSDGKRMSKTGGNPGKTGAETETKGGLDQSPKKTASLRMPVLLMLLSVFVLVPFTVFFGSTILDNRKYYFVSLLVMLELLLPAYIIYEARKPGAIEIVVIASMCALTVSGRVIFYMLPTIKPVIALVMMAGLAFGPLDGMIVGATSMLVSNMFFGQGPWTPWQMFVFALIGFISGMIGRKKELRDNRLLMCLAGIVLTIVVFGGIMNPASIIMYEPDFNKNMIMTAYATGFPLDLLTAAFTAIFIWFGLKPVMKRCERVKRYMRQ